MRSGRVTEAAVGVKLVQNLLAAAAKKSFMQEAAAGVVLDFLESVDAALAGQVLLGCPELLDMLTLAPGDSTPEVGHWLPRQSQCQFRAGSVALETARHRQSRQQGQSSPDRRPVLLLLCI